MAASRARWLVTASRTGRGGKAAPALLKWTTLATPGVSDLSDGTSSAMTTSWEPGGGDDAHTRWHVSSILLRSSCRARQPGDDSVREALRGAGDEIEAEA